MKNLHLKSSLGISKILFVIGLSVALIVGAVVSYLWTMGYYASEQYRLPTEPSLSIETINFPAQNTSFFEVELLNPSYSPRKVKIERLVVLTEDDVLHDIEVTPNLPFPLEVGDSQTFRGLWNWANYTGSIVKVIVFVSDGSGSAVETSLPNVRLTVKARFNATVSLQHFNVTVQNAEQSATYVDITKITINQTAIQNITINGEPVSFPHFLNRTQSVTFTCALNWTNYQGKTVAITVETLQGYTATWQGKV